MGETVIAFVTIGYNLFAHLVNNFNCEHKIIIIQFHFKDQFPYLRPPFTNNGDGALLECKYRFFKKNYFVKGKN